MENAQLGEIAWLDLTVENAGEIRDFYQSVIGWSSQEVSMGDYADYSMIAKSTDSAAGGICHARGGNADLPPMWLPYFLVDDAKGAAEQVKALGGELITPVKSMGSDKFVVIKDPAGAACALYQKG
ncbi:VOC family protein [Thalassotalea sp. M1531]|uniref:VOC family protein n=1 Tax=Thalassotalea algicola TaxID=2716224 RepID=A0A7Y0LGD2_9GAMM|nr:VOC family protein [Thalassotalea algicola]NMP32680.1 VOC family protein [Thalassotalea algicola]